MIRPIWKQDGGVPVWWECFRGVGVTAVAAAAPVTITPECSTSSTTVSCPPVDGGGEATAMVGVEASSANTTTTQQQQQHNVTASVPRMEDWESYLSWAWHMNLPAVIVPPLPCSDDDNTAASTTATGEPATTLQNVATLASYAAALQAAAAPTTTQVKAGICGCEGVVVHMDLDSF